MLRCAAILVLASVSACHSEATRSQINAMVENGMIDDGEAPLKPATDQEVARDDRLVDYRYAWPAAAAAIPSLDALLRADAEKQLAELAEVAADDKEMRDKDGIDFNRYSTHVLFESFGASDRLLSLAAAVDSFTGGAHPNHGTRTLLWDREQDRRILFADLFESAQTAFATIERRWCAALDRERAERRGDDYLPTADDIFAKCPGLEEISVIPTDRDHDGRFERLRIMADPYVAGPYAEGDYEVELGVDAAALAAITPDYRESFALQRQ